MLPLRSVHGIHTFVRMRRDGSVRMRSKASAELTTRTIDSVSWTEARGWRSLATGAGRGHSWTMRVTMMVAGVLLALIAALTGTAAAQTPPAQSPALPQDGDFTLGASAGSVLIGLTARPAQPGPNTLLLYVLPSDGPASAGNVSVHLSVDDQPTAMEFCSRSCRTADVNMVGGDHIDVTVDGPTGGSASFDLPALPPADGSAVLQQLQDRMHRLSTYRVDETIGPNSLSYGFEAPDRMRVAFDDRETIFIGPNRYTRSGRAGAWQSDNFGTGLTVPSFTWEAHEASEAIVAPTIAGADEVDGVSTQELAFFQGANSTPLWYRLFVDDTGLVRRVEMDAQAHFMIDHYFDFDAPFTIEPPSAS